jgi:NAD(P)H-hydrate repair Nnr-like enzyme with NAD(P)H-hydrate dehydratase domain
MDEFPNHCRSFEKARLAAQKTGAIVLLKGGHGGRALRRWPCRGLPTTRRPGSRRPARAMSSAASWRAYGARRGSVEAAAAAVWLQEAAAEAGPDLIAEDLPRPCPGLPAAVRQLERRR